MIAYACRKQVPGDPISSEICDEDPDSVKRQFYNIREEHFKKECKKPIAEMVHSFSPEESKTITPEIVNKIGHELATTMFPGHQVLVVTHLDRDHFHNHIFVNRYHHDTGKLTRDDMRTVRKVRAVNDQICKSYGLSIPNQEKQERLSRVPKKVSHMIKKGRFSYIADMMQKADFARSIATNYAEYQSILGQFDINVRIERKNISYEYPGQKVAKRGKSMGTLYDKAGLEKSFKANDELFQRNPKLRALLESGTNQLKGSPGANLKVLDALAEKSNGHLVRGVKDYSQYPIVPRREAGWARASEEDLVQRNVPIDEMRRARRTNIVDYCKKNGIALESKGDGLYTIKGRPYVELSDYEWSNKRNKTRGNLIDLVASHKGMTFVEALAEVSGNKRLLLLQQEGGEVKRTFTSFYIPKPERDQSKSAVQHLSGLLRQHGARPDFAEALLKSDQAQVSRKGLVRLFGKGDENGSLEFTKGGDQSWSKTSRGMFSKPFFEQHGTGRTAVVYTDPFAFMAQKRKELFPQNKGTHGQLALMSHDVGLVDAFVSGNRHLDKLQIVTSDPKHASRAELDFFNALKARYAQTGVSVEFISLERSAPGRRHGLER